MEKRDVIKIIDFLMLGVLTAAGIYLIVNRYAVLWIIICWAAALVWSIYLLRLYGRLPGSVEVKTIALLGEEGEAIKEWHIAGEQGILIGKSRGGQTVDIDLSQSEYAVLVAGEHAVMNCINGQWYLEDLGSRNGTGIKKREDSRIKRLTEAELVPVNPGDQIFIAKSILVLQK